MSSFTVCERKIFVSFQKRGGYMKMFQIGRILFVVFAVAFFMNVELTLVHNTEVTAKQSHFGRTKSTNEKKFLGLVLDGKTVHLPPGLPRSQDVYPHLAQAIEKGKQLLKNDRLNQKMCGGSGKGIRQCLGDYKIAVIHMNGTMKIISFYEGREPSAKGFQILLEGGKKRAIGVNVPFDITSPEGWTVLAVRTVVRNGKTGGRPVVYVPYTSKLDTPEIRERGLKYLVRLVGQEQTSLRKDRVESRYFSERFVAEMSPADLVLVIQLTEHIRNANRFINGDDEIRTQLLNRELTILGGNLEDAYGASISAAGAAGIGQWMETSWNRIQDAYTDANLPNADIGRFDHSAAVKATFCHLDEEWRPFSGEMRDYLGRNPRYHRMVFGAGYNASIDRVARAIKRHDSKWKEALPSETKGYVEKIDWIHRTLFGKRKPPLLPTVVKLRTI